MERSLTTTFDALELFRTHVDEREFHFMWNATKRAPQFLFHYTGNKGLKGIVGSTSLWATDARYLNDAQEVDIALDAAQRSIQVAADESQLPYAKLLRDATLAQLYVQSESLYVFSLSENGDSLGQWRGYCKDRAGYAIGFDFQELSEWCETEGLVLSNVVYGTDVYSRDLKQIFCAYLAELQSYFPRFEEGEINADLITAYARRFAKRALRQAPFVKHEGFGEEDEWRIVRFRSRAAGSGEIRFREGEYSLVPYTVLEFAPATFFSALGLINVKPSEHAATCSEAMRAYIRSEAGRHALAETKPLIVEVSTIPFRPGF